jgi:hypothetical protein
MPISVPMKLSLATLVLALALAAPAAAEDATLEGYGGDGALLVGIESKDTPFGNSSPSGQGGRAQGDGNLVAERAPAPASGSQGATTPAPAPSPTSPAPDASADSAKQPKKPRDKRDEDRAASPQPTNAPQSPREAPAPVVEGADPAGSSSAGLPFTGNELVLLLAALAGIVAMGAGMRRMAAAQPRF